MARIDFTHRTDDELTELREGFERDLAQHDDSAPFFHSIHAALATAMIEAIADELEAREMARV